MDNYDLPHKQVFDRLVELHHKVKAEARKEGEQPPRTVLEHIHEVLIYMDKLLGRKYSEIFDSQCMGSAELQNLSEIVEELNEEARSFLLWTALYHDIGKAVIKARHGPEGADIIKDSGDRDRERFRDLGLDRSDMYLMSDLIRFHKCLGSVGLGETSYLTLTEVLYPVTNISLTFEDKFLDYLLLVHLADAAGAIGKISWEEFAMRMHDVELIKKAHDDISKKVYEDIFKEKPKQIGPEVHMRTVAA